MKDGVWLILHEMHIQEEKENKILQGCALYPNECAVGVDARRAPIRDVKQCR